MDIIDLEDSSEEGSEEEGEADDQPVVVVESSTEESDTEETSKSLSEKDGEINIVNDSEDSENNDIILGSSSEDEEDRINEPIIFLQPVPEVASTSTGSKPHTNSEFDFEDYEHFVDPSIEDEINLENKDDDQGQTSKVKEIALVGHDKEGVDSEETWLSENKEDDRVDSVPLTADFKVREDKIFISIKNLDEENLNPLTVLKEIERRNLILSESLIFEDWTVKFVSLQILQSLDLQNDHLKMLVNQVNLTATT